MYEMGKLIPSPRITSLVPSYSELMDKLAMSSIILWNVTESNSHVFPFSLDVVAQFVVKSLGTGAGHVAHLLTQLISRVVSLLAVVRFG